MKHTNFEISYSDHNREEVVINKKKRHGYWKLKVASLILSFLIWLAAVAISQYQASQGSEDQSQKQPTQEQTAE